MEARWYHSGYTPTLEEYLDNGKLSIAQPSVVIQSYICSANPIEKEKLECLLAMPYILQLTGTLCRIVDDYGTSSVSHQCHIYKHIINALMHTLEFSVY